MNKNIERFIRYAKIDTQADENTGTTPSTEKQKNLSRLLVKELKELGLNDAYMDEYGIVYAHLDGEGDVIGLNAHIDTALEVTDENVNPRIVEKWDGSDIHLNEKYTLSLKEFPHMKSFIGKDLVVTDGNTLLGADDKAGIAIIMGVLEYIKNNPHFKHHPLAIAFTVDEEIGEGPKHFSLEKMKADYAFTIDGGAIDRIDFENFNAQQLRVKINGDRESPPLDGDLAPVVVIGDHVVLHSVVSFPQGGEEPFQRASSLGGRSLGGSGRVLNGCSFVRSVRVFVLVHSFTSLVNVNSMSVRPYRDRQHHEHGCDHGNPRGMCQTLRLVLYIPALRAFVARGLGYHVYRSVIVAHQHFTINYGGTHHAVGVAVVR